MPDMSWKTHTELDVVENIDISNDSLRWEYSGDPSDRFAIYFSVDSLAPEVIVNNAEKLFRLSFNKTVPIGRCR